MTFTGKVVLVAGGTGGLGRAVSLAFLNEGAELLVTYRKDQELTELKSASGANASRLAGRQVDVTDEAAVGQPTAAIVGNGIALVAQCAYAKATSEPNLGERIARSKAAGCIFATEERPKSLSRSNRGDSPCCKFA